jgi:hypothetical protein
VALMGRLPGWLIVGAFGVLATLAAADAIRPHAELRPSASPATTTTAPELRGHLVFADADCNERGLRLPERVPETPVHSDCDGRRWSRDGSLMAVCRRGVTDVFAGFSARPISSIRGCGPAWRDDGALSVIRDGDLLVIRRHGAARVFVSRRDLAELLRSELPAGASYRLAEVQWLALTSFAAIARGREPWQRALFVYTQGRLDFVHPEFGQRISDLRVSPLATSIAFARNELGPEFVMLARSGEEVPLPRIANARDIAWSPDEIWVALETRTITAVARAGRRTVVERLPLGGDSLDWRP